MVDGGGLAGQVASLMWLPTAWEDPLWESHTAACACDLCGCHRAVVVLMWILKLWPSMWRISRRESYVCTFVLHASNGVSTGDSPGWRQMPTLVIFIRHSILFFNLFYCLRISNSHVSIKPTPNPSPLLLPCCPHIPLPPNVMWSFYKPTKFT